MLRFCKEILWYFQYSIYSKDRLLVKEASTGQNHNNSVANNHNKVDLELKTI